MHALKSKCSCLQALWVTIQNAPEAGMANGHSVQYDALRGAAAEVGNSIREGVFGSGPSARLDVATSRR